MSYTLCGRIVYIQNLVKYFFDNKFHYNGGTFLDYAGSCKCLYSSHSYTITLNITSAAAEPPGLRTMNIIGLVALNFMNL